MNLKRLILAVAATAGFAGLLCIGPRATGQSNAAPARQMVYGAAFYNLENLFDTINNNGKYDHEFSPQGKNKWDSKKYWKKIGNLAYAISEFTTKSTPNGPAVIGVSEIENESVLKDLVAAEPLRARGLRYVHHDSPDRRGVDVGLLYDPSQFRVLNVTNHYLHIDSLPNFRTRDQMCVVGLMGPARVAVIVNHWPSRRGGKEQSSWLREAAAALSRHIADSLLNIDPNMGIIVMGDLNDDPGDRSCAVVLEGSKTIEEAKEGAFYNPFWKLLDNGIGSYTYRGGWDLFDQIIVGYNFLPQGQNPLEFVTAKVWNDKDFLIQKEGQYKGYPYRTFSGGAWIGGYSDHLPTEVFFKIRTNN